MAVAQAPVPQARVSPEPRSQTRISTVCLSMTRTNSVFTCSGKIGCFSNFGPIFSRSRCLVSSTKTTAWGLPMETQVIYHVFSSISIGSLMALSFEIRTGISAGVKTGSPISTVTVSTFPSLIFRSKYLIPPRVSREIRVLSVK